MNCRAFLKNALKSGKMATPDVQVFSVIPAFAGFGVNSVERFCSNRVKKLDHRVTEIFGGIFCKAQKSHIPDKRMWL
ncbi:Uncharacterized protein dnm_014570 [Desulfonema magnum]|uniref:Uncharacterized protein n=1 Tax=Desulfonema magnum TaxID=45655 RepID=A0A975BH72_9BACT|nr:Uncharacterized protein dnm_014570 [Desulfonema magnum]